ncbi:hypothetical protein BLN97_06610 [Bradyrhizobium elkanii]|nr:hypothetical protein BLN97_06610 [Bradyrhizobium elkanii]
MCAAQQEVPKGRVALATQPSQHGDRIVAVQGNGERADLVAPHHVTADLEADQRDPSCEEQEVRPGSAVPLGREQPLVQDVQRTGQ